MGPLEDAVAAALVAVLARGDVRVALRGALAGAGDEEWLDADAVRARFGLAMRVLVDARRRGELELGRAGRRPVVRRSELERWVRARAARAADERPGPAPAGVYELAVAAARRGRSARSA